MVVLSVMLTACTFADIAQVTQPQESASQESLQEIITASPTDIPTKPPINSPAELPTEPAVTAPEVLLQALEARGVALQDLEALGCTQLVMVTSDCERARMDMFILEENRWCWQETLSCSGYVGRRGTKEQKAEGDKATPKGLFSIEQGFYINESPQTGLQLFQITADTYWVDDPASRYYNKRIEGAENKDWVSAEHMLSYGAAYEYGFVIGYNLEAIPYAGSAIFFHVGSKATSGCVATQKEYVLRYLAILEEEKNPHILIN